MTQVRKLARTLSVASTFLVLSMAGACKEGDVGGFDGSVFDDAKGDAGRKDAGAQSVDDAGNDEDAGAADSGGPDVALPTIDDVALQLAQANCAALLACRGQALLDDYLLGQDCVENRAQRDEAGDLHYLSEAVQAGRVAFHPEALAGCVEAITELGCDAQTQRWPWACEDALEGKVAFGGDCDTDLDCKGRAFCEKTACPGTCAALRERDEACAANHECADGLSCVSGSCEPLGQDEADCSSTPCGIAFVCQSDGSASLCRSISSVYAAGEGDPCIATGILCKPDLVCASTVGTMGSCARRAASGGRCKRAQPNQCPTDEYCDAAAAGEMGTCVAFPKDGEPCLDRNQACASGHVCVVDTCKTLKRVGEVCVDSKECFSGRCDTVGSKLVCVAPAMCSL